MKTRIVKLIGLVLTLVTFGMAPDYAATLAWAGSLGVIAIFLANFFVTEIPHRSIVHAMIGLGLLTSGWALLNIGTWYGWIGLVMLMTVVEENGEEV